MQIWNNKTPVEILKSMNTELAKAQNELKSARADVEKASNRIAFCLSAIHNLNDRDLKE